MSGPLKLEETEMEGGFVIDLVNGESDKGGSNGTVSVDGGHRTVSVATAGEKATYRSSRPLADTTRSRHKIPGN